MPPTAAPEASPALQRPKMHTLRPYVQGAAMMAVWFAAVFGSAGRIGWLRGWICFATYMVGMLTIGLLVRRTNPGLVEARSNLHRQETKLFDKFILAIFFPLMISQPVIAGFDAVRFHWSSMPFATAYVGVILFGVAMWLIAWTLMVNPHAESTVRIQTERDHRVVASGPYRIVRHPMYVGFILMYPAIALMFGSEWALAIAAVIVVLFVLRTALEDQTLRRELPGYDEFTRSTRFRLVPGLW